MIPASGAGGPGFDPRSGPDTDVYFTYQDSCDFAILCFLLLTSIDIDVAYHLHSYYVFFFTFIKVRAQVRS